MVTPRMQRGESEPQSPLAPLPEGFGTVCGSAVTLVSTCIGTGLLALPFAFATSGVPLGTLLLAAFATWSGLSSYLLCQCCDWARCYSYEQVMVAAFGRLGALVLELVVIWLLLGAMTSLLVVTGDALGPPLATAGPSSRRTILVALDIVLVALPLSWVQSPYSLRYSNAVAVFCTLLVVFMLMARSVAESASLGRESLGEMVVELAGSASSPKCCDLATLRALPIIMLSLGCQVQVPGVYYELQDRSLQQMGRVLTTVSFTCFGLYNAIAISGLLMAGSLHGGGALGMVPGNVLDMFPAGDQGALMMRAVMAVAVTLVYPMLCLPCRSTLDHLIFGPIDIELALTPWARARHAAETVFLVCLTLLLATLSGNLASVFGLTGATAGALICYMLPPACYLQLRRLQLPKRKKSTRTTAVLCALSLCAMAPLSVAITWQEWQGA